MNMYCSLRMFVGALAALLSITGCSDFFSSQLRTAPQFNVASLVFDKDTYPAVVLGGGVGGMTAGVYLAMANVKTLLVQGSMPGGLLTQSLSVRNWPGEIELPGMAITDKLLAQARKHGVEVKAENVIAVDTKKWPYTITLSEVAEPSRIRTVKALTLIIAMGALSNYLTIPGEKEYWSKGVTNCAVCEGGLYKDKEVCVVGGGNSAIEEAHYLAGLAKKVTVFVRGDSLRATDNRKDDLLKLNNVEFVFNTSLKKIEGDAQKVTSVMVVNNKTKKEKVYQMDGVFLAIGFRPNTAVFKESLTLTPEGYIRLVHDQQTSVAGVYAVGDIVDPRYKQAVTAAGDGCRAALQAHAFLLQAGYVAHSQAEASPQVKAVAAHNVELKTAEVKHASVPSAEAPVVEVEHAYTPGLVHEMQSAQEVKTLVETSTNPVVMDFHATWCGPCRAMSPLYKKLAEKYKDRVTFIKINIDDLGSVATQYRIQGVPTFVFIKAGDERDRIVGGGSTEKQFAEKIDALV